MPAALSAVDQERSYLISALGLSAVAGAKLSLADLRRAFYANPPSGGGGGSATLAGLTDVNVTGVADKQALAYDSASGKYKPKTVSAIGYSGDVADLGGAGTIAPGLIPAAVVRGYAQTGASGNAWPTTPNGLNVFSGGSNANPPVGNSEGDIWVTQAP